MDEQTLERLIELFQEISPHLWEIARRQALIDGIGDVYWTLVTMGFAGLLIASRRRLASWAVNLDGDEFNAAFTNTLVALFVGLALFGVAANIIGALRHFANPEYYALQALLELVK